MKHTVMSVFLVAVFTLFNCSACVEVQNQPSTLDSYGEFFTNSDMSERALVEHIAKRTVRVVIKCTIYDTRTNKVYKNKKNYDAGWGTGAIVYSSPSYSLIQTAEHVAVNKDAVEDHLIRKCTGFKIERRNIRNEVTDTVEGKIKVIAVDKNYDIAVLRVPHDFGVKTKLADRIYLGQSIRVVGFPSIRYVSGKHLSYERGWVATVNTGRKAVRWGVAAYFGNSGGAVWNQRGEIVGTVVSIGGFRTLLGVYIPQQNHAYGPDVKMLRKFYQRHKLTIIYK